MTAYYWDDELLIKANEYGANWYTIDEQIHVVASNGNMRREAIDAWAAMLKEVVDSIDAETPSFIIIDVSAPQQGFTPYTGKVARDLLNYVVDKRKATSYIAIVLSNSIMNQMISIFFQQILRRTQYPRQTFMTPENALVWMREQLQDEA